MARTFKLNDLQLILLSTAAQRSDGYLLPPPDGIGVPASRIAKLIPPLLKQALVDEVEVTTIAQAWRADGERQIGLVINDAGRTAIGVEAETPNAGATDEQDTPTSQEDAAPIIAPDPQSPSPTPTPRAGTKQALVLGMLRADTGASLAELVEATGWLAHTTRAALTGLRKKGHAVLTEKSDSGTRYRIAGVA